MLPALNEVENLLHVFAWLPDGLHEVVLGDDRLTDSTVEKARAQWPNCHIVARERRRGGVPSRPLPHGHRRATMALRIVK